MGCDCVCHAKLESVGVRGCCFQCEDQHDPLRNALSALEYIAQVGKADPVEIARNALKRIG